MKTLMETVVTMVVATMVLILSSTMSNSVLSSTLNSTADMKLDSGSRVVTEEIQYQMRGASRLLSQATVGATTYTTGSSTIVLASPSYTTGQTNYFLTGKEDTIIFTYDQTNKQVQETIVPASGSARPARTLMTIGKNIESLTFTYNGRERFVAMMTGTANTFTLKAAPSSGSVLAYVKGVPQTVTVLNSIVSVTSSLTVGDNVQIFYTPQTFSTTAPVNRVNFTVQQSTAGTQNGQRTTTATGSAQLRNCRN